MLYIALSFWPGLGPPSFYVVILSQIYKVIPGKAVMNGWFPCHQMTRRISIWSRLAERTSAEHNTCKNICGAKRKLDCKAWYMCMIYALILHFTQAPWHCKWTAIPLLVVTAKKTAKFRITWPLWGESVTGGFHSKSPLWSVGPLHDYEDVFYITGGFSRNYNSQLHLITLYYHYYASQEK